MQTTLMHTVCLYMPSNRAVRFSSYYLLVSYYFVQIPTHLKTYKNILLWKCKNYGATLSTLSLYLRNTYTLYFHTRLSWCITCSK